MINEICADIRNYFTYDEDKHIGDFSIVNGVIVPSLDLKTDYIRIVGSRKNDGVHRLSDFDLIDEGTFHGAVWDMSVPKDFLELVDEIEKWQDSFGKYDSPANSPYTSESFGGYSYSKNGVGESSWQNVYAQRLKMYRRIRL